MLDHHAQIVFHGEFEFVVDAVSGDPPPLGAYPGRWRHTGPFETSKFAIDA